MNLTDDCLLYIATFLGNKDLWNLRDALVDLSLKDELFRMIKRRCINNINRILTAAHITPDLMARCQASVSGSTIVQCLLEEYWSPTDVDIYVPLSAASEEEILTLETHLQSKGYSVYESNDYGLWPAHLNGTLGQIADARSNIPIPDTKIRAVRNYIRSDDYISKSLLNSPKPELPATYQVIYVDTDDVYGHITDSYDFDFLRNEFKDGRLIVHSYRAIFQKRAIYDTKSDPSASVRRKTKYENRGFTFDYDVERPYIAFKHIRGCEHMFIMLYPRVFIYQYSRDRPSDPWSNIIVYTYNTEACISLPWCQFANVSELISYCSAYETSNEPLHEHPIGDIRELFYEYHGTIGVGTHHYYIDPKVSTDRFVRTLEWRDIDLTLAMEPFSRLDNGNPVNVEPLSIREPESLIYHREKCVFFEDPNQECPCFVDRMYAD